jgi:xanthine dehydrogenase accessory factor
VHPTEQVLRAAVAAIDRGQTVAMATVVAVRGSTPRHVGARMAVTATEQFGTIGGGRVEFEVVDALRRVLSTGQGVHVEHHLVRDLAMCCGGSMSFALTPLHAASEQAVRSVVACLDRSEAVTLATNVDGTSLAVGAITPTIACDAKTLLEPLGLRPRAILFGLGHVARAIGPLAQTVGFDVVVCDDVDTDGEPLLPWASKRVDSFDPRDVAHAIGGWQSRDFVLIVTRDHAVDQRILESLLDAPQLALLGMIGSRGKVGRFFKRLQSKGLIVDENDAKWQRVVAPIGLDIGAETPAEIAVAVVAQLIALLRSGSLYAGRWQPRRTSEA